MSAFKGRPSRIGILLLLVYVLVLTPCSLAADDVHVATHNSIPQEDCERLLQGLSQVLGGSAHINSIYDIFRITESKNDRALPTWLHTLEDSIIDFYSKQSDVKDPETAALTRARFQGFCSRWGFEEKQGLLVLVVYGLKVFEKLSDVSGSTEQIKNFLSDFYFEKFLTSDHPAAKRHPYYVENVGKKSVLEMATELRMSMGAVYRELGLLRISTVEVYHSLLLKASEGGVALDSSLSPQFLEFVRHHLRVEARGVSWNRHLQYEGRIYHEEQLLAHLYDLEFAHSDIANVLNTAPLAYDSEGNRELRTENSVKDKLIALGISTERRPNFPEEVFDGKYGYLKYKRILQIETVWVFLKDHLHDSAEMITQRLGVSLFTLKGFLIRNRINFMQHPSLRIPGIDEASVSSDPTWEAQIKETARLNDAIEKTLAWIERNPGQMPTAKHFRLTALSGGERDVIGISMSIFSRVNSADFWLAVKERAIARNISCFLVDIRFRDLTEDETARLRPVWQMEILQRSLRYMDIDAVHPGGIHQRGTWPVHTKIKGAVSSFISTGSSAADPAAIGTAWQRITAIEQHSTTARTTSHKYRIFDNSAQYFISLYNYIQTVGDIANMPWINDLRLLHIPMDSEHVTEEIRQVWKKEFLEGLMTFTIQNQGQIPTTEKISSVLGVSADRVAAWSGYAPGQPHYSLRIFDSGQDLYRAFLDESERRLEEGSSLGKIWWVSVSGQIARKLMELGGTAAARLRELWKQEMIEISMLALLNGDSPQEILDAPQNRSFSIVSGGWDRIFYDSTPINIFSSLRAFQEMLMAWLGDAAPTEERFLSGSAVLLELRNRVIHNASVEQISNWRDVLRQRLGRNRAAP